MAIKPADKSRFTDWLMNPLELPDKHLDFLFMQPSSKGPNQVASRESLRPE
jgi:hypothetical protein